MATEEELLARIGVRPDVFGGKPVVRDRRLAVEHVLGMLAAGDSVETILEGYPWLEREDVLACLVYARRLVDHERIEPLELDTGTRRSCWTPACGASPRGARSRGARVVWAGDWAEDPGDAEILARAHAGRVLVTLDKDFGELAIVYRWPHSGIVRLVGFGARAQGDAAVAVLDRFGSSTASCWSRAKRKYA